MFKYIAGLQIASVFCLQGMQEYQIIMKNEFSKQDYCLKREDNLFIKKLSEEVINVDYTVVNLKRDDFGFEKKGKTCVIRDENNQIHTRIDYPPRFIPTAEIFPIDMIVHRTQGALSSYEDDFLYNLEQNDMRVEYVPFERKINNNAFEYECRVQKNIQNTQKSIGFSKESRREYAEKMLIKKMDKQERKKIKRECDIFKKMVSGNDN